MVYAAPCSLSHLGISTLPAPKGWHSHRGGGSPQQASVPHSRPWRSQQLTRRRAEGALCPVGPTWLVGPVATRAAQKQPAPGRGWAGERPGSPCRAHRAGPSPAAAVLSVFRAAGSAHLSSHHQASKEDSQERILALLHWRRWETEPRDCVQALPGMTWEAAEGAGASSSPRTTAGHAASSSTLKYPPEESLGPSPVMLDYEERRVRASERRWEGLLGT